MSFCREGGLLKCSYVAALLDESALGKPDVVLVPWEKKTSKMDLSFASTEGEGQVTRKNAEADGH